MAFSNTGSSLASGVILTDSIPLSVTVQSVVSSGVTVTDTGFSPAYVWQIQDLAPGQGGVITLTGYLSSTLPLGLFTNTAFMTTSGPEITMMSNSASADLTVTMLIYLPHVRR